MFVKKFLKKISGYHLSGAAGMLFIFWLILLNGSVNESIIKQTIKEEKISKEVLKSSTHKSEQRYNHRREDVPYRVWATEELRRQKKKAPSKIIRKQKSLVKKKNITLNSLQKPSLTPSFAEALKNKKKGKFYYSSGETKSAKNVVLTPENFKNLTKEQIKIITEAQMNMRVQIKY